MADTDISKWSPAQLQRFIKSHQIQKNQLPTSQTLQSVETTDSLTVGGGLSLSPQAIAYIKSLLTVSSELAYVEFTSTVNATSSSSASAVTVVSAPAITFDGNTKIRVSFSFPEWTASDNSAGVTFLLFDTTTATLVTSLGTVNAVSGANTPNQLGSTFTKEFTPTAGSHTYFVGICDAGAVTTIHSRVMAAAGGPGNITITIANNPIAINQLNVVSGWNLICDQTLGGAQASFDTNTLLNGNIPAAYKHLMIMLSGRGDSAVTNVGINLRINGDAGNNYYNQTISGVAAAVSGSDAQLVAQIVVASFPGSTAAAGFAGGVDFKIYDYLGTTLHKQVSGIGFLQRTTANGSDASIPIGGAWANTAAINRLTLLPAAGNFVAGSRFSLYGLI